MTVPTTLASKCAHAIALAQAYIRGRQSRTGGFCFYRHGYVDEPSLGDTYYAVASLKLLNSEVPSAQKTAAYVGSARIFGLTYLYYCAFTLDLLGRGSRVGEAALEQIRKMTIAVPRELATADMSAWLESVRKTIRLQQRFIMRAREIAPMRGPRGGQSATPQRIMAEVQQYSPVAYFVGDLMKQGGCGVLVNLWDTYLALSIGSLLGLQIPDSSSAFVDALQLPPFGFTVTTQSVTASVDAMYAGVSCCKHLELPVRYEREVLEFTLACQSTDGGFAYVPGALPNLEFTYRALQVISMLNHH